MVKAEDPSSDSRIDTIVAMVQPVNDPPVLPPDTVLQAIEDTVFAYHPHALDVDGDPLSYSVSALPSWLSFSGDSLFGNPNGTDKDTIVFIIATDGLVSDTQRVDIQLTFVNDKPLITDPFSDINLPLPISPVLIQDSLEYHFWDEEDGRDLVFLAGSHATTIDSVTIQKSSGLHQIWLYTPPGLRTIINIEITARDSNQAFVSDTFMVFLGYESGQPIITAMEDTVILEDHDLDLPVQAYDREGDDLSWTIEMDTLAVMATLSGDTLLHVHPQLNWWGQTNLEVRVYDGGLIDSTVFTLIIQPVNDPPALTALPDTVMNEDEILNIPIYYQDPDDSTFTLETTASDTGIQVVINSQLIQILPDSNWYGNSWITWSVSDQEYTQSDTFSIVIVPENDRPHIAVNWEEEPIIGQTSFRLSYYDDDLDTLSFQGQFSYDSGITWNPIILVETNNSLNPSSPSRIFTWNSTHFFANTEKYWGIYEQVMFRLWANDLLSSSDTITVIKSLLNLAGDYNENQEMDAEDIGRLLKAYYGRGDSITANDIGPSSGEEPYIISVPDSVINFEDLATFSQTWYYDAQNGARIATRKSAIVYPEIESNPNSIWSIQKYGRSDNENSETVDVVLVPVIDLSQYNGMDIDLFYDNQKWPELLISTTLKSLLPHQIVLWKQEMISGYFKLSVFSRVGLSNNSDNQVIHLQFPKNKTHLSNDLTLTTSTRFYTANYSKDEYSEKIQFDNSTLLPDKFVLHQNFPNPFNPVTTIRYDLPGNSFVKITIFDLLGRNVTTLVAETQEAGFKSVIWNATNNHGKPVSAGVYLYQINAGEFMQTKKMLLLK